jgi:hypothetical protein
MNGPHDCHRPGRNVAGQRRGWGFGTLQARTDEGDQELADGGHAGIPEEKGSYLLLLGWPEWLGEAGHIPAPRPPAAPDQAPTRKSWLREMSRRLTRISTSAISTAATP